MRADEGHTAKHGRAQGDCGGVREMTGRTTGFRDPMRTRPTDSWGLTEIRESVEI